MSGDAIRMSAVRTEGSKNEGLKADGARIERFEVPGLAQYGYVVSQGGEAVAIDVIRDIDRTTGYLTANGLKLVAILETHIHADFAAGSVELAAATGAERVLSAYDEGERFVYAFPHRALRDGEAVPFGASRLVARHTPGHTPEHLSFLLYEEAAAKPTAMFTGDFLFAGSLGRPDLLGEEAKLRLAHDLWRSARERIADLPDELLIYPGHGAGSLCGTGMSERLETTLGYERATDAYLRYDEDEFVERMLASVPEMPSYYPRMKQLNADGAPVLGAIPGGTLLSPAQARAMHAAVFVDLRGVEAFAAAHVPGSLSIGAGQNLSLWAGWLLDAAQPIVLVTDRFDQSAEEARRSLVRVGLDRIAGVMVFEDWIAEGGATASLALTPAAEVQRDLASAEPPYLVDVRNASEWSSGAIAGAHHVMLGDLDRRLAEVPREREIVVACGSGYRAAVGASLLQRAGYERVSVLAGGMMAWQRLQA